MARLTRDRVLELINEELVYKPGWEFRASEHWLFEDAVGVEIFFPAHNSDRSDARQGYPTKTGIVVDHLIRFGRDDTEDDVLGQLLAGVVVIESHEAREFLRVKTRDYDAPFHPHREDGRESWLGVKRGVVGHLQLQG